MDQEIVKLTNVLRRIARSAGYGAWVNTSPDAGRFCVSQYNKVLVRLLELEPAITTLFSPLPENTSLAVTRIAARELAAYFEDEAPDSEVFQFGLKCRPRRFGRRSRYVPIEVRCD